MSSFDKDVGGRNGSTVWRKRRRTRRARATEDNDFHPLVRSSIRAARDYLLAEQDADQGAWCGSVLPDPHVTAEYLLLLYWLGLAGEESETIASLKSFLLARRDADGAWSSKHDQLDVSTSALCYLALKLSGIPVEDPAMKRAAKAIRARGGADAANGLTRFYLALFGQDSYDRCPVLPPEFLLLPLWSPLNVTRWSRWARALLVPLSVVWACRPTKKLPIGHEVEELFLNPAVRTTGRYVASLAEPTTLRSRWWQFNARTAGIVTQAIERAGIRPFRRLALRACETWMAERLDEQNGVAGCSSATVLAAIAFDTLGHDASSLPLETCLTAIRNAQSIQYDPMSDSASPIPCDVAGISPSRVAIQDTAIATQALAVSGVDPHSNSLRRGLEWLLQGESTRSGDWSQIVKAEPGGWSREFPSDYYPHITATAQVLQSLREPFADNPPSSLVTDDSMVAMIRANSMNLAKRQIAVLDRVAAASRRARRWLLAMQNPDGGWPCADRHHVQAVLYSPNFSQRFPIHDQSTAEATGCVLQSLGSWELGCGQSSVDRAVSYLRQLQQNDGSWSAVHGGSDVRATASVMLGLRSVGISWRDMTINAAARWLLSEQRADGGWAVDSRRAESSSCPLQTAWALLALDQAGMSDNDESHRAVQFLVDHQEVTGTWAARGESPKGGADLVECESELSSVAIPLLSLARWGLNNRV